MCKTQTKSYAGRNHLGMGSLRSSGLLLATVNLPYVVFFRTSFLPRGGDPNLHPVGFTLVLRTSKLQAHPSNGSYLSDLVLHHIV